VAVPSTLVSSACRCLRAPVQDHPHLLLPRSLLPGVSIRTGSNIIHWRLLARCAGCVAAACRIRRFNGYSDRDREGAEAAGDRRQSSGYQRRPDATPGALPRAPDGACSSPPAPPLLQRTALEQERTRGICSGSWTRVLGRSQPDTVFPFEPQVAQHGRAQPSSQGVSVPERRQLLQPGPSQGLCVEV